MTIPSDTELLNFIEQNKLTITPIFYDPEGHGYGKISHWEINSDSFPAWSVLVAQNKDFKVALLQAYAKLNK